MDGRPTDGPMSRWMHGWMGGPMGGQTVGWMDDGWIKDGWIKDGWGMYDGSSPKQHNHPFRGCAVSPVSLQARSLGLTLTDGRAVGPKGSWDSFWSSTTAWLVPGRAEPVWFGVRRSCEQCCTCTGGSSNPVPGATRTPGLGLAFVPSYEIQDGENVLGRRHWRR